MNTFKEITKDTKTFNELVCAVLDEIERQELSVDWDKSGLKGSFNNDGVEFEIEFIKVGKNEYTLKFFRIVDNSRSVDMFNDNKKVGNVLKSFIAKKDPSVIAFMAATKDKCRVRMYDKIKKLIGLDYSYKLHSEVFENHKVYVLHKYSDKHFKEIKLDLVKRVFRSQQ